MSERQKQLLIVVGIIALALILFMRGSDSKTTVVTGSNSDVSGPSLQTPVINIAARQPFVLPNFGISNSANSLSAIGACCADCRPQTTRTSFRDERPSITFVTNMGNSGPNIFNYAQPTLIQSNRPDMLIMRNR